jgi:aminomethyltransferase
LPLQSKNKVMQRTIFYEKHKALGARIVPFAGFEMPVEYTGVTVEHNIVREKVGLFDVSHMGEFWVKGPKALDLLQKVTSNDVSKLTVGKAQYSCFPNGKGGIVDDLIVYKYDEEKYFLVVNASNIDKDWEWLNKNNTMGAETENASDKISQLAIQGPNALPLLQKLTNIDLKSIPYYSFKVGPMAGASNVIISATGYTGSGGFELYFYNSDGNTIWENIMNAGNEFGLQPIGLAARDTLRLEMGYALYGNDIDDTTSPIEAGLGWITKFTNDKNFIDKPVLFDQKNNGTARKLVGFEMVEKAIPRHGYDITDASGNKIGIVTSGTMSPTLKKGIGMGYVPASLSAPNSEIFINIRNKNNPAKVVNLPFYKNKL